MALVPRFCAQCGGALEARVVEGWTRQVCSVCGTIAYRNPLPVASALVLNERREVLLIKRCRDPQRGEWCLPIGFAEMGETIAQAALRELHEETGLEGRILRLLDVDSYESSFYGDLLIVSYEAEATGGRVAPGTDAEEAAWFALDRLPPLAFLANQRSIAALGEAHREEWAIRDSFESLQTEAAGMLSDALVALVRDHADEIADLWLADVRVNPTTPTYHGADPEGLRRDVVGALARFGDWLRGDRPEQEIRDFYRELGARRRDAGFALADVQSALMLLRKHIWSYARTRGVWQGPLEAYRVLELDRRLVLFFDRALYHVARAYA